MNFIFRMSLALVSVLGFCVLMLVPSVYGFVTGDALSGRTFLYGSVLGVGLCVAVGLSTENRRPVEDSRALLLTLIFVFAVIPVGLAVPLQEVLRTTTLFHAYLDMVSAITTTALPVYDLDRMPEALILWRSVVAWAGGLYIWTSALVIFLPLRLGGYETLSDDHRYAGFHDSGRSGQNGLVHRFFREGAAILPIYASLTMVLFLGLTFSGHSEFSAAIYAMGTVSSAGFLPDSDGLMGPASGFSELLVFCVLLFSLSRRTYGARFALTPNTKLFEDREFRLGLALVCLVTLLLFIRQFFGAVVVENTEDPANLSMAFWGGAFTSLSFLTTTGYVSQGWSTAQNWSGLTNTGVILIGLATIGGGAATAAGGIKLLRISSLLRHSQLEIEQLSSPNRVFARKAAGFGGEVQNAIWAWVFFMFFFLAFAVVFLLVAYSGAHFEQGMVLAVASLTNTGPVATVVEGVDVNILALSALGKSVLAAAMVLGRVETLAFLALLNPEIWRR